MVKWKKRRIPAVVFACIAVICISTITTVASLNYLTPDIAAEKMHQTKLEEAFKDEDALKSLVALISIKDENGEYIELPSSIKFYVDGNEIQHTNGNAMYTVAENLVQTKMEIINQLKIDLSNLSGSLGLATGKKTICIDYYLAKDGVLEENVEKYEIETEIKKFLRHSLVCIVEPENGPSGNDLWTVKRSVDNTRKILMNYIGDLIDPEVTVRLEIKNGDAFYSTSNIKSDTKYDMLLDNNSIDVVFENIMSAGTYRVVFDLVDRYGEKKATESIIFICE